MREGELGCAVAEVKNRKGAKARSVLENWGETGVLQAIVDSVLGWNGMAGAENAGVQELSLDEERARNEISRPRSGACSN
ncbi:hypothetical protein ACLOJK_031209 [Asimina triloba]